jgi:hypothetical protein
MKKIFLLTIIYMIANHTLYSQGCVAIRSTGAVCTKQDPHNAPKWQFNTSYRYFKSFRHFVGTDEQEQRIAQHTQVINHQHTLNLTLVRHFDTRWSMAIDVPLLMNTRSSLYEHGGNAAGQAGRHNTNSSGVGDVRITGYRWLLVPIKSMKGNIQVGLGLKLPTGNDDVEDYFIKSDSVHIKGPVDQSIQLGDGGFGVTAEINAFYNFSDKVGVYGNFYYLVNPRGENGVLNTRGEKPSQSAIDYETVTMSVPDQYMARAGMNLNLNRFSASAGMRMECIPSSDLIGNDKGFRRPGYVLSVEPGASYSFKKFVAFATVPVAVQRNRTQSHSDKLKTAATGVYAQGDAAFADYSINFGLSFKL